MITTPITQPLLNTTPTQELRPTQEQSRIVKLFLQTMLLLVSLFTFCRSFMKTTPAPSSGDLWMSNMRIANRELKVANDQLESDFNQIYRFLSKDKELFSIYQECQRKTAHKLIPPPEPTMNQSNAIRDPVLKTNSYERRRAVYFRQLKTHIIDFLETSPEFYEAVKTRLQTAQAFHKQNYFLEVIIES